MLDGDRFSHDVNFTGVNPLIIWSDVTQFKTIIISQAHPGVFADDQVPSCQDPAGLLPHDHKGVQVDNLTRQDYGVTLLGS